MADLKRFVAHPWRYIFTRSILFLFYSLCRGRILVEEQFAAQKCSGFILIANHVSYLDGPIIYTYLQHRHNIDAVCFVKEKLFEHWFWGTLISPEFCIRISNDGNKIVFPEDFQRLKKSRHIILFPEGTRSRGGKLGEFKQGAAKLAQRLNLPILPVALTGFYETWPPTSRFPRPRRCTIVVGSPYVTHPGEDAELVTNELRSQIQEMLAV